MSCTSSRAGGVAAKRRLAQLRRHPGQAERRVDAGLGRRRGQRLERSDVRRRAGRAHQLGAEALRRRDHQIDRARPRRSTRAACRSPRRSAAARRSGRARARGRVPRTPRRAARTCRASGAGRRPARRPARPRWRPRARAPDRAAAAAACGATSARASASITRASVLGPTPGTSRSRPRRDRRAELVRRAHAERPGDLERAPGRQPEEAAQADEPGHEVALELAQLGDLPGLHQLAQPRLDPRADAPQPAHAAGPHELLDRHRRRADRLGRPAVGARLVRVRLGELEQRRERVQAVGDLARCPRRIMVADGAPGVHGPRARRGRCAQPAAPPPTAS